MFHNLGITRANTWRTLCLTLACTYVASSHAVEAQRSVIVIDNTALGGNPAVVTNLKTGTAAENTCAKQDALRGNCNSFSEDNLQTVQRAKDGALRLDIGVNNPLATRYSNAHTADQLDYFAGGNHLFDLNKFRAAADALAARNIEGLPAGSYGTMDWRQFITNAANRQTMYGLVRVKIKLLKVEGGGGGDNCTGGASHDEHEEDEHDRDDHDTHPVTDDRETHKKSKGLTKVAFKKAETREHEDDDTEHKRRSNACGGHRDNEDDDEHDGEDSEKSADHSSKQKGTGSTISNLMARAKGMLSKNGGDTDHKSNADKDDDDSEGHAKKPKDYHYVMCGTPHRHTSTRSERENRDEDERDDKHSNDTDHHASSQHANGTKKSKGVGTLSRNDTHSEDSVGSVVKEDHDDEHDDDDDDDDDEKSKREHEHELKVCECQPHLDQPLARGQAWCVPTPDDARINVRGALLFDFVGEDDKVIPTRDLPPAKMLSIPIAMPISINASNDVSNKMGEIDAIADKTRTESCANGAKNCFKSINVNVAWNDVPQSVREAYGTTPLTEAAFNKLPAADRYHLQMPSGYTQGWLDAFSALRLTPHAWHTLGFKLAIDKGGFTPDVIRSTAFEDIPALMYQGGLVHLSHQINISGMIYVPEVLVVEQNTPNLVQYINGAVLVRDGFFVGSSTGGTTLLSHDRTVYDQLPISEHNRVSTLYVPPQNTPPGTDTTVPNNSLPTSAPKRGAEWIEVRAR